MSFRAEVVGEIDLLALHRQHPERYPLLLQSVAGHPVSGRYDLLFGFPGEVIEGPDFFGRLNAAAREERIEAGDDGDLPFVGGWFIFLGYEAARLVEPRLQLPPSPYRLPEAMAVRCPAVLVYDRSRQLTTLYSETSAEQLQHLKNDLQTIETESFDEAVIGPAEEDDAQPYREGVARLLEYIRAGDIFQANLSRAWRAPLLSGTPAGVYARLRRANPAPFAGLMQWRGSAVLSSSPERLLQIDGERFAQTRPIAGTRPRGTDAGDDARLREGLLESLKERAEHVMLIDLERNDLGRVCEPGSIEVSELMTVESYAHVHHIVSNVRGRLRPETGPGDALKAVYPGGTITGCPKVRAIEILAELEGVGRGPYTGAMGYLSRCGRLDSNILIRSLMIEDGRITLRAGAGIVADSVPEAELAETRAKARGLLLALGAAD
jgi:anthranilate synthase component 1